MESTSGVESATFRTPDGVLLAYGSIAPVARDMTYTISRGDSRMKVKFQLGEKRQPIPPEGSVVFLHGWGLDASSMLPWALPPRPEAHTPELQSLMRNSYTAFCLKK